ncbi:hypothetical protein HFV04_005055 [Pseudomonas sp. BIGb0427]|uniref:hypothetical protein n=1 Tax=unclassified Pseudomonas TaxID=196821 RepID=UPI0018A6F273|nr:MULTISPECIES: hypothetical protein [unclassified Pseudomonas]QPG64138.1 hypothetical protein HFV04_005055 [Pseudomonas sp. BIGb0427]UVM66564.1 hypothetical protein LOY34_25295 [Pseudomonas sp. B21-009]
MYQSEANQYFSEVILRPQSRTRSAISSFASLPGDIIEPGKENGAVVGEAVVGMTDRLSPQNATDVMNCVSLAQQIADKRFQKETNLRGWTDEYYKALKMMGWNTINYARQQYSPSATSFSMEKVALDIIRAAAGGAQEFVTIAEKALIATNENGEALSLLENNSASESYATFQTLPCTETGGGKPSMILMSIDFKKAVRTRKVLFWTFKKSQVDIYRAAAKFELNVAHYAQQRNRIEEILGKGADDYFAGIEL